MNILIDASNIRAGGGIVYLQNLLQSADPQIHNFQKVVVYGGNNPLENLPQKYWLDLREIPILNRSLLHRLQWQRTQLGRIVKQDKALLFVPGGLYLGEDLPYVTMCPNLLPFSKDELKKYFISGRYLRMKMLAYGQKKTFFNANGIIFLTKYSEQFLSKKLRIPCTIPKIVIPFGSNKNFLPKSNFSKKPKNILYVSTIDTYKRQIEVVKAVAKLRNKSKINAQLYLVGSAYKPYEKKLKDLINEIDPNKSFIKYFGEIHHNQLPKLHQQADIFIFASTCETFGISLLEAMSSGLPIACSKRNPMLEILKDAGVYFNPDQSDSIFESLNMLFLDESLRKTLGLKAQSLSQAYSWERCTKDTFSFLKSTYQYHFS